MKIWTRPFWAAVAFLSTGLSPVLAQEQPLTMDQAVQKALSSADPYIAEPLKRSASQNDVAIAEGQLPDPQIKMAFANWPTDSFSYTQEPMTQVQLGVTQAFPRGDSRRLKRERQQVQADSYRQIEALRRLEVILETRKAWLDIYYLQATEARVTASRQAISELVSVTQSNFATGKNKSQDIFRAEMELALLDDRLMVVQQQQAQAQARLSRRLGEQGKVAVLGTPAMPHPSNPAIIKERLATHPKAKFIQTKLASADKAVLLAGEQYKPGWAVSVGYGARGGDRADFATVGVTLDVPLFTKNRQDRRLSAAKKAKQAEQLSLHSVLLDMEKQLKAVQAVWEKAADRVKLYTDVVRARAKDTSNASLASYQNGVTDFPELVRSRLAELEMELKLLNIQRERHMAQVELLFLEGGDDA